MAAGELRAIGYVRVSTDQQADRGVSLQAQIERVKAMAVVQGATLLDVIVDGGESAKSMKRPGLQRILSLVEAGAVGAVIVAKLDRLTRSVKDLCSLLELFEKRRVALISVAESLDTGSAGGRLVITIMGAVSQWEREAIGERTRDALRHKRANGERVGNISYGLRLGADGRHVEFDPKRAGGADGNSRFARRVEKHARNRGHSEPAWAPNSAQHAVATRVGGPSAQL